MTKKKIIIGIICIVAVILIVVAGVLIKNKLNEDRKNSMATYQLNTASAWSIKYNKNPNFTVELIEGNLLKVEAIGGESTIKITCSDEKNEEITIVANGASLFTPKVPTFTYFFFNFFKEAMNCPVRSVLFAISKFISFKCKMISFMRDISPVVQRIKLNIGFLFFKT